MLSVCLIHFLNNLLSIFTKPQLYLILAYTEILFCLELRDLVFSELRSLED